MGSGRECWGESDNDIENDNDHDTDNDIDNDNESCCILYIYTIH